MSGRDASWGWVRGAFCVDAAPSGAPCFCALAFTVDLIISMDDRYLYLSNWWHGDIRQYELSKTCKPRLVGQVRQEQKGGRCWDPEQDWEAVGQQGHTSPSASLTGVCGRQHRQRRPRGGVSRRRAAVPAGALGGQGEFCVPFAPRCPLGFGSALPILRPGLLVLGC